tara:strand:+ start:128 stop:457 length:330 start_codon:yes stop_codon:yes gene_type:complete
MYDVQYRRFFAEISHDFFRIFRIVSVTFFPSLKRGNLHTIKRVRSSKKRSAYYIMRTMENMDESALKKVLEDVYQIENERIAMRMYTAHGKRKPYAPILITIQAKRKRK